MLMEMQMILLIAEKNGVKLMTIEQNEQRGHSNTIATAAKTEMRKTMMVLVD